MQRWIYYRIYLFGVGAVWLYSVVLDCTTLHSIVLHFNISAVFKYFPILIWQKWTKYWTKVIFPGNSVPTKVTLTL